MSVVKRKIGTGKTIAYVSMKKFGSKRTFKNELGSVVNGKKVTLKNAKSFVQDALDIKDSSIRTNETYTFKFKIDEKAIRQGYNARMDESLGMRRGASRTKRQSMKSRRDESKGMSKSMGRRAYASVRSMDRGRRTRRYWFTLIVIYLGREKYVSQLAIMFAHKLLNLAN